jgi:hypothetical protein
MNLLAMFIGLAAVIFLAAIFASWIHENPIKPPTIVILKLFGKPIKWFIGGQWYVVIPYIQSAETIDASSWTISLPEIQDAFTPDGVAINIREVGIGLRPDPNNPFAYLQIGGKKGVEDRLIKIVVQEIRQWANSPETKPLTWKEAQGACDDLIVNLKKKIIEECRGDEITLALKDNGVILETVVVGEIAPKDQLVVEDSARRAREELQRKAEFFEIETELEIAKKVSESLNISREKAYQLTKDYKILQEGKSGGIFKLSFGQIAEIIKFAKNIVQGGNK